MLNKHLMFIKWVEEPLLQRAAAKHVMDEVNSAQQGKHVKLDKRKEQMNHV